jgi:hypothetical protein
VASPYSGRVVGHSNKARVRVSSSRCRPGRKCVVSLELDQRPDGAEVDNVRIARGSGVTNWNDPSLAEQPGDAALNANRDQGRNRATCVPP